MKGKKKTIYLIVWLSLSAILLVAGLLAPTVEKEETIQEAMRDAVLHESNRVSLFGWHVNPAVMSTLILTGVILLAAASIRVFVIPKFKERPGRFQLLLEAWVSLFGGMAREHSPERNQVLGGYLFFAGSWVFISTLFEMLGIQWITTRGTPIALPAPLADINGACAMGITTFMFIVIGGACANGFKGLGSALKEFSLPISMSFRLFGALLSGLLVTEMVYYSKGLSVLIPVFVGIMFTLLHAIIQTYVLTTLTSTFYGEAAEKSEKKKTEKALED